jgi:hypothetical protein
MAVNSANTFATMKANFKEVYADGIAQIMPDHCILQKRTPFNEKPINPGKEYVQPVTTKRPQGWTFEVAGAGAFNINPAQAGETKDARISANQMILNDVIDIETAARATADNSKAAFREATSYVVERMGEAARNQLETNLLWGQKELTQVLTAVTTLVTCKSQEYAPGIFIGCEDAPYEFFSADGNTQAWRGEPLDDGPGREDARVRPRRRGSRRRRHGPHLPQGHVGRRNGVGSSKEAAGIMKILTNTGTIFNLDASKYNLWKSYSARPGRTPLDFFAWLKLNGKGVIKGLQSGALGICSVDSWNDMANDEAAFRRYNANSRQSKVEVGVEEITYYGQAGSMSLRPHAMMKKGYAPPEHARAGGQGRRLQADRGDRLDVPHAGLGCVPGAAAGRGRLRRHALHEPGAPEHRAGALGLREEHHRQRGLIARQGSTSRTPARGAPSCLGGPWPVTSLDHRRIPADGRASRAQAQGREGQARDEEEGQAGRSRRSSRRLLPRSTRTGRRRGGEVSPRPRRAAGSP